MNTKPYDSLLETMLVEWRVAKQLEQEATRRRRGIEDGIKALINFDESREGNIALPFDGGRVVITARLDHKVDGTLARQLATKNHLEDWLERIFRWKPELEVRAWKKAPEYVTQVFAPAITTKPGRATFSLEHELEKGDGQ
jgi:hypothetical protein